MLNRNFDSYEITSTKVPYENASEAMIPVCMVEVNASKRWYDSLIAFVLMS